MRFALCFLALAFFSCASCRVPEDRSSAYAAEAGKNTIVLGSCGADFNVGWSNCELERGSSEPFPVLHLVMTNPGDWAVSDCSLGIYKTGAQAQAGIVDIDLTGLKAQAEHVGFCLLKIETNEKFPDPQAPGQTRTLYMRGGMFIEMIDPAFNPIPSQPDVAFCLEVARTTKGRTKTRKCKPW